MLSRASAASTEPDMEDVILSTAAVLFLGTPHRGSPDLADLGELARSLVSAFQMQTSSATLHALGLETTDLERVQESFSSLWQKHDFRVKTFQESLPPTAVKFGALGKKVVPYYSSLLGDHRERAETIHANHMDMCRFTGADSPGYRQVAAEIYSIYRSIAGLKKDDPHHRGNILKRRKLSHTAVSTSKTAASSSQRGLSPEEERVVESIWYPTLRSRHLSISLPAGNTCQWLFNHELYSDWFCGRNQQASQGLLRITGKPGAGKSVLMKEAFRQTLLGDDASDNLVAAFFFDVNGLEWDRSLAGLFRSLLYQLVPKLLRRPISNSASKELINELRALQSQMWTEPGCRSTFQQITLRHSGTRKVFIFIDALDECTSESEARNLAYFWRDMTKSAHQNGISLNVCLSTRQFPNITLSDCPEINMGDHNYGDIDCYTERRFQLSIAASEPQWRVLKDSITEKAAGVFLWAVLVADEVTRKWEEGSGISYLLEKVDVLPTALEDLYARCLGSIPSDSRSLALRVFWWAVLAQKSLRLHEWHHVMAFIQQPAPKSLKSWRSSADFTSSDAQLERKIRTISRGLIEVKNAVKTGLPEQDAEIEALSVLAGAGSLNLEQGESRVVGIIHDSVRRFFLEHDGFSILGAAFNPIGNGHIFIMGSCLDYINIAELNALVSARVVATQPEADTAMHESKNGNQRSFHIPHNRSPSPTMEEKEMMRISLLQTIQQSFGTDAGIDIMSWVFGESDPPDQTRTDEKRAGSPTKISTAGRSQVLEDYPALLSYIISEFFTHAQAAEALNTVGRFIIISRLLNEGSWQRWLTLKETISPLTKLRDYAVGLGLNSWVSWINHTTEMIGPIETRRLSLNTEMPAQSRFHATDQTYVRTVNRRGGSVASFGSAGSHMS